MLFYNSKYLSQKLTGVQRVAIELEKRLSISLEVKELINPYNGLLGHFYEQFILPFKITNKDILISPINLGPIFVKNHIVIIHDTATFDNPKWFSKGFVLFYKLIMPLVIKKASVIVTVSNYSRSRIVELFNVEPEKVVVIPNGVDPIFFKGQIAQKHILSDFQLVEKQYVLSVCSIEPRKNIPRLIEAWMKSNLADAGYKLAIVGGAGKNFSKVDAYTHESIKWLGYVNDADLPIIYQNAKGFAYVSLYEGFGLPPLEAMAAGIPVLCSNVTSLPEVVGDTGIMVNPESEEDIALGLKNLINADQIKIDRARLRAKTFTWDNFTEKFIEVIDKVEIGMRK